MHTHVYAVHEHNSIQDSMLIADRVRDRPFIFRHQHSYRSSFAGSGCLKTQQCVLAN